MTVPSTFTMNKASGDRTLLGEPMSKAAISLREKDPLAWHLQYWLDILVIGMSCYQGLGQILSTRINIEHGEIADHSFRSRFREAFGKFQFENQTEYFRKWDPNTFEESSVKMAQFEAHVRDLQRMLKIQTKGGGK